MSRTQTPLHRAPLRYRAPDPARFFGPIRVLPSEQAVLLQDLPRVVLGNQQCEQPDYRLDLAHWPQHANRNMATGHHGDAAGAPRL